MDKNKLILEIEKSSELLRSITDLRLKAHYAAIIKQAVQIIDKAVKLQASWDSNASLYAQSQIQQRIIEQIAQVADLINGGAPGAVAIISNAAATAGNDAMLATAIELGVNKIEAAQFTFLDSHAWLAMADGATVGKTITQRVAYNTGRTASELAELITRGLAAGQDSAQIATVLGERGGQLFRYARTMAHNEQGRMTSAGNRLGLQQAAQIGIKGQKTWYSNRDKKVRSDHAKLDGQSVAYDGEFEVNGHYAQMPHEFGVAAEDINCRCRVHMTRAGRDIIRTSNGADFDTFAEFKAWASRNGAR